MTFIYCTREIRNSYGIRECHCMACIILMYCIETDHIGDFGVWCPQGFFLSLKQARPNGCTGGKRVHIQWKCLLLFCCCIKCLGKIWLTTTIEILMAITVRVLTLFNEVFFHQNQDLYLKFNISTLRLNTKTTTLFIEPVEDWITDVTVNYSKILTVGRRLFVGLCGRSTSCMWPYYPATWLWPALPRLARQVKARLLDTAEPFWHRPRPMLCLFAKLGPCHIRPLWLQLSALSTCAHRRSSAVDSRGSTRLMIMQPTGWTIWRRQHSWNEF